MRINSIIHRYIFREMLSPFAISLGFLTFVFLLTRIIDITNLVVNYHASMFAILKMILYSMPSFLEYTLPMSIMMGVLLTFLKMASDMEIVAIKAGGGNLWPLLMPVFLFCTLGMGFTLSMTLYGSPWGKYSYKLLSSELASSGIEMNLKEGIFNDSFTDVMIYIGKIDKKERVLYEIFIDDRRNRNSSSTVVAPHGKRFFNQETGVLTLRLFNSIITQVDIKTGKVNTIKSQTYDINIDLARDDNNKIGDRERDEMYPDDLLAYIKNEKIPVGSRLKAKMEFQEKFSLPFACITLGLLAVPLGVRSAFSRKGSGIGLGFACFMVYYLLLVLGGSLGKSGKMSPLLAMWSPDIVTGITGIYFFYRVSREKSIGLEPLTDKYNSIRNKIKTRNKKALL